MTYDIDDETAAYEYLQAVMASNLDGITFEGLAIVVRNYLQQAQVHDVEAGNGASR